MNDQVNGVAMVADLSALLPEDTAVLRICKPGTSIPTGWEITMAGPGHPKTVALGNKQQRDINDRNARLEAQRQNGRKVKPEIKADGETTREFIEGLVARIVTWTPIKIGDEAFGFSEKSAVELLSRPAMGAFVGQIVDFLIDERAFMKDSANS